MKTLRCIRDRFEYEIGLEVPQRIRFAGHKGTFKDEIADHLLATRPDFYTLVQARVPDRGDTVLIVRDNGIGDILLTTPILRALKARGAVVDYMTREQLMPLLKGNPNVRKLLSLDRDNGNRDDWKHCIDLRRVSEDAEMHGYRGHRIHAFARALDLDTSEIDMHLDYYILAKERIVGESVINKLRKTSSMSKVVAFGWATSRDERNWSIPKRLAAIDMLVARGYAVAILFNDPILSVPGRPEVLNCAPSSDIRHTAAIMSACDVALMPDTGLLHIASALDIPTVTYMGSFPATARCTHKQLLVLNAPETCSLYPCYQYRCWNRSSDRTPVCIDVDLQRVIESVEQLCPIEASHAN